MSWLVAGHAGAVIHVSVLVICEIMAVFPHTLMVASLATLGNPVPLILIMNPPILLPEVGVVEVNVKS